MVGPAWFVGVSWAKCALLATVVITARTVFFALNDLDDEPALPPLDRTGRDEGARREVSRLSWGMIGQENRVGEVPFRRLRALAATRLSVRGIDLVDLHDHEAARRLLGPLAYDTLIGDIGRPPSQAIFQHCLAALERLDELDRSRSL